jgi:hypothetical protein
MLTIMPIVRVAIAAVPSLFRNFRTGWALCHHAFFGKREGLLTKTSITQPGSAAYRAGYLCDPAEDRGKGGDECS